MKFYYLSLVFVSFFIPFIISLKNKIHFYSNKRALFAAISLSAIFFIAWDIVFTSLGVWGFTPKYNLGIMIFNLPLEEVLFFIGVPFACMYIYASLEVLYPIHLPAKNIKIIVVVILILLVILAFYNTDHLYTFIVSIYTFLVLFFTFFVYKSDWMDKMLLSYLVSMLPFLAINGLLTGMATNEPVVWYNNSENLGIRIGTIPVEDFIYNFALELTNLLIFHIMLDKFYKKADTFAV